MSHNDINLQTQFLLASVRGVAAFAVSYGASQARYFIVNISVLPNIDYYVAELDISHSIPC